MARESHTETPDEPRQATMIGPEGDRTLLFTRDGDWIPDPSGDFRDEIYVACEEGFIDVNEWR